MKSHKDKQYLEDLEKNYRMLSNLWASGIRDYHNLNSSYLTANSILIAAIAIILRMGVVTTYIVSIVFSFIGILICLQMGIALGRFRSQNAYWEWNLRIIEGDPEWKRDPFFKNLYKHREEQKILKGKYGEEDFKPNFAIRYHRKLWAPRMKGLPFIFGTLYTIFIIWSIVNILN
ncbi:MAG TPA: hypothetical protein ENI53_01585 [Thermoplasmatales archaeon]|nr:hypothetical protein [Thermoplasmatales archaeon]